MSENILEKIIKKKEEKILNLKRTTNLSSLKELIDKNNESFSNLGAAAIQGSANLKTQNEL